MVMFYQILTHQIAFRFGSRGVRLLVAGIKAHMSFRFGRKYLGSRQVLVSKEKRGEAEDHFEKASWSSQRI
jgi:hypothetical protein